MSDLSSFYARVEQIPSVTSPIAAGVFQQACTGCGACAAACPQLCLEMNPDLEGFLYPHRNEGNCNHCGLCTDICGQVAPIRGHVDHAQIPKVFAGWHLDADIRGTSSSGGVFSALAEYLVARGGVIVGAAYDDNLVVRHRLVESTADLRYLRGSKYVQSDFSPALYRKIRDLLRGGRQVLVSGTPCQIAGLRGFLQGPYENLYCCDLACHGVPSPLFWAKYLTQLKRPGQTLMNVCFRDKTRGWKKFSIRHDFDPPPGNILPIHADTYMKAFLRNYSLRPACYNCPFACVPRVGDITLADFWGVAKQYPQYDTDDVGTSLILVNSPKGERWLASCSSNLYLGAADLDTAVSGNPVLVRPCQRPLERESFYPDLNTLPFPAFVQRYRLYPLSPMGRALHKMERGGRQLVRWLKKLGPGEIK